MSNALFALSARRPLLPRDPRRLDVRAFGRALAGTAAVVCLRAGEMGARTAQFPRMESGRRYRLALPMARPDSCNVTATVRGAGAIRAQILG